jgi:MFS family permease
LLEIPLSSITQRFPARRVIALGFVLAGLGFGATGLATSFAGIAATIVVWTVAEIAIAPVGSAYVAELAPPSMRGRFMGAWGLTWSLGLTVGPTAGAWLFTKSPPALWIASAALGIAAATLMLAVQGPSTRRA